MSDIGFLAIKIVWFIFHLKDIQCPLRLGTGSLCYRYQKNACVAFLEIKFSEVDQQNLDFWMLTDDPQLNVV